MMRIAFVCADPGVPVFGCKGSSIHVQEVIRALLRSGAVVELFAARFGGVAPPDLTGVACFELPLPPKGEPARCEQAARAANGMLASLLNSRPRLDLVYERYSLWSHAGMTFAKDAGILGVLEVNAPLIEEQATHRHLSDRPAAEAVARSVFGTAHAILAVSSGVAAYLRRFGVDARCIHVVPNGVDVSRFAPGPPVRNATDLTIGFIGTLKPWHGLSTLVAAVGLACEQGLLARLLIVGDGPERGVIEAELDARGLAARVEFTGAVPPSEVPALLSRMDVAVAPYPDLTDFYFSPLKIMEYMAAGCAIVASRIGDIDGLIEHDVTGLLCPPGDAAALAQALVRLHAEPLTRTRLGTAARAKASRDLGWNAVADRILSIAEAGAPAPALRVASC